VQSQHNTCHEELQPRAQKCDRIPVARLREKFDRDAKLQGEIDALNTTKTNKSVSHKNCRAWEAIEKNVSDTCQNELSALDTAKTTACDDLDDLLEISPNINLVPAPATDEKYKPWLIRVRDWAIAELAKITDEQEACNNLTVAVSNKTDECEGGNGVGGLKAVYHNKKNECDGYQSSLESSTCMYADKVEAMCEEEGQCYNHTLRSYTSGKATIDADMVDLQDEWSLVSLIQCYLQHLLAMPHSRFRSKS